MTDTNDVKFRRGDIVDICQTVNGQNLFLILELKPLDISYGFDINRKYEYDKRELLDLDNTYKEIEIVGNVYDYISNI